MWGSYSVWSGRSSSSRTRTTRWRRRGPSRAPSGQRSPAWPRRTRLDWAGCPGCPRWARSSSPSQPGGGSAGQELLSSLSPCNWEDWLAPHNIRFLNQNNFTLNLNNFYTSYMISSKLQDFEHFGLYFALDLSLLGRWSSPTPQFILTEISALTLLTLFITGHNPATTQFKAANIIRNLGLPLL